MMRSHCRWTIARTLLWMIPFATAIGCGEDRTVVLLPGEEAAPVAGSEADPWPTSIDAGSREPDAGPPPEPFSMPFDALVENRVRWAALWVSVVGARVERGMDGKPDPNEWEALYLYPAPEDVYVELDIQIASEDPEIVDYSSRATWDLILADGTRVHSHNALGLMLSPGDTATTTLRYPVDEIVDLAGASLELNSAERGAGEPEIIPLDAAYVRRYPLRLTEVVGAVIDPVDDVRAVRLEVLDAAYDLNDPVLPARAARDRRLVRLDVIVTSIASNVWIGDENFYLIVDGRSYPVDAMDDTWIAFSDAGVSAPAHVLFEMDDDVRQFELAFLTSDRAEQQRIAVDLANAVLVEE